MDSVVRRWYRSLAVFGALMGLMVTVVVWGTPAGASNQNPGVLPSSSTAFGRTYGAWSAAWWQYVEAQPVASNPLVDPSGAGCRVGQSGPVFFLVGANGQGFVLPVAERVRRSRLLCSGACERVRRERHAAEDLE